MKIYKNMNIIDHTQISEFKKYYNNQEPVLIKGLAKEYPAGEKWTLDYLKEKCGDVIVDLFDNSVKNHTASAFTTPDIKMKFSEYLEIISKDQPSSLRMFLFNMFKRKPELRKDFPCPKIFEGILGKFGYMFFGSKGITVRIHQDIDMSSVLLTQFHGRKKVILISPKYSTLLYRLPFNTYSLVNLDNPDYQKYPGLALIEAHEYVIEPGDTLFIPCGYWHYITYIDGGFGVSYRKIAPTLETRIQGLLFLAIYMPFDKLMNFIFGEKWLAKKEKMAHTRADKVLLRELAKNRNRSILRHKWLQHYYRALTRLHHSKLHASNIFRN